MPTAMKQRIGNITTYYNEAHLYYLMLYYLRDEDLNYIQKNLIIYFRTEH